MPGDDYVTIECEVVRLTAKAILIDVDGAEIWVPRSCIHGGDERRLDSISGGDELSLRIFEWIAEREGIL